MIDIYEKIKELSELNMDDLEELEIIEELNHDIIN